MSSLKEKLYILKKSYLHVAGVLVLLSLAALLLWFTNANNTQALSAMVAQVRFYGEYRIENGEW